MELVDQIRKVAKKNVIYSSHAVDEMQAEDEIITADEITETIAKGEIIEDYPEDRRGHSCLMMAKTKKDRYIHVICAPKEDYLLIITAYIPSPDKWKNNFKTRK